jgi:hypothetical protein
VSSPEGEPMDVGNEDQQSSYKWGNDEFLETQHEFLFWNFLFVARNYFLPLLSDHV